MERPPSRRPSELSLRASDTLDLFDPAVVIPGALVGLALLYLGEIDPRLGVEMSTLGAVAAGVVLSCAFGHLSFALGRMVRRFVNPWRRAEVTQALVGAMRAHGLQGDGRFRAYFNHPTGLPDATALVPRLWAELRQDPSRALSYAHLRRLWQRAAILDGMIPGLLIWIAVTVLAIVEARGIGTEFYVGIPILLGLVGAIVLVVREAGRTDRHLLEELVATVATPTDPSFVQPAPPASQPVAHAPAQPALPAPSHVVAGPFAPSPAASPVLAAPSFERASVPTSPPVSSQPFGPSPQAFPPAAQPFAAPRERESLHPSAPLEEVVFRPATLISGTPLKAPDEPGGEPPKG